MNSSSAPAAPAAEGNVAPRPWRTAADRIPGGAAGRHWDADRRATALARLDATGLPDRHREEWRYTSLEGYAGRWEHYLAMGSQEAALAPDSTVTDGGTEIRVTDGSLRAVPRVLPAGVTVSSLRGLPAALEDRARELLRKSGALEPEGLADLNSALLTDVLVVAADAGHAAAGPLTFNLHSTGPAAFGQPRLLVDLAPGARLTLVIRHTGQPGALANAVTETWVGDGAQLTLVRVQELPDDGMLTESTRIELAAAATATVHSVDVGGELCRQSLTIVLAGAGASATVDGMFLADGRRHLDNRTRLEHRAPATTSRESFRGLADANGHGVFNGQVIVYPGAAGSSAALTNRNLLLASTAEIDTKPELEIYVDDVRCSHGATTGQLDANAVFYLRSRGLDEASARQVLTVAFLRESLRGIDVPGLRAQLEAQLEARLGGTPPPAAAS